MDEPAILKALEGVGLGGVRFIQRTNSTNDDASTWAAEGAADLSVVLADEQVRGRGSKQRQWLTPPGAALALSVVVRMDELTAEAAQAAATRLTALGALAICSGLESYGLKPRIKWPNDVLLDGRKSAGVLAESAWDGTTLKWAVVGMGVNVRPQAVPPDNAVRFPATCVEQALGRELERLELLHAILTQFKVWRGMLHETTLWQAWQERLAFRDEMVTIAMGNETRRGRLVGLANDGGLQVQLENETMVAIYGGEVRPASLGGR